MVTLDYQLWDCLLFFFMEQLLWFWILKLIYYHTFLMGGSEKVISYWSNTNKIKMLGCAFNSAQSVRAHSTHTFYHTEWVRSKHILSELYKFINYALHSESLSLSNFVVYPKYCFFLCNLLEGKQGDKKTMRKSEYWEW